MSTLQFKAYQILREKFGESDSQVFIEFLEAEQSRSLSEEKAKNLFLTEDKIKSFLATKEDINKLDLSTKTEINRLELSLETKIIEGEARLVRQIYVANIVQLLATVGSVLVIVKFLFAK